MAHTAHLLFEQPESTSELKSADWGLKDVSGRGSSSSAEKFIGSAAERKLLGSNSITTR